MDKLLVLIKNMLTSIKCKKCGTIIEVTEAILEEVKSDMLPALKAEALKETEEKLLEQTKNFEVQLKKRDEKLDEFRSREIKLLEDKTKLMQEKKEMELKIAREIEEKSKSIYDQAYRRATEEHNRKEHELKLREMEKDKTIEALKKDLEEANRKAQLSSQQLQGEVLEIEVEEILKKLFPQDFIEAIAKGVNGSDIRHTIKSPLGATCGVILWECKRAKNWSNGWTGKLKADLRTEKADIPVLVTTVMPKDIKTLIEFYENIYVCDFQYAAFLATVLRERIISVAKQKAISANRENKAERLYNYVTSNDFKNQLKFMFETYKAMREQTDKERKVFEKLWKDRDFQLDQLVKSTVSIYTSIASQLGTSSPQLEEFDINVLASGQLELK